MEYRINEKFTIRKQDSNNWVVISKRQGELKADFGGKKKGDKFESEDVLGYYGDLVSAWKMLIKLCPNYSESKTELNKTIQKIQNLLAMFG